MDIKHIEVRGWLKNMYGDDPIPPYETTEKSINILHELMTASCCSEAQSLLLIADYTRKAAEYNAEALQIERELNTAHIQFNILSIEGHNSLMALANTSQALDVQCPTTTNLLLAVNQLEMEEMQVEDEMEQQKQHSINLLQMSSQLSKKLGALKSIAEQAEASWNLQRKELAHSEHLQQFCTLKFNDYLEDIYRLEAKLKHVGMEKQLRHGDLCKKEKDLQALETQVKELEAQLASYTLPPDMTLAQVKVEEARQEMRSILENLTGACNLGQG